ncbi:MAG: MFS transporter [Anaerolineae bacterium]
MTLNSQTLRANRPIIQAALILTFSRLIVNMARRFPYAFIPAISRQLGVPLTSVQNVMALQAGIGVTSPLFGPLVQRYGPKRAMVIGLLLMIAASGLGAAFPTFQVFAAVMLIMGFAKMLFDPSVLAYLGERVPYHRRGLVIGFVELSWSMALLIAAPVVGIIFTLYALNSTADAMLRFTSFSSFADSAGLQIVFLGLGVLSALALVLVLLALPGDVMQRDIRMITPGMAWRVIRDKPPALAAMFFAFSVSCANEIFLINYGIWMEESFGLLLAALGIVTTIISVAEIGGEMTVMTLSDRIGKRRMALIGAGIATLIYAVLPFLTFSLPVALMGIFIMFLAVETGIVAAIPMYTEILPDNRAIMLTSTTGSAAMGRLVGAVLGGLLYALTGNFVLIGFVSLVIGAAGIFLLWRYVFE